MISILIVNFFSLFFASATCMAESTKSPKYNWTNKKFFSDDLKEYDLSLVPESIILSVRNDFKQNPYVVEVDSYSIRNEFNEIIIERALASIDGHRIYLLCSIRFVSDLYIVYELEDFVIDSKYTTSGWNIK